MLERIEQGVNSFFDSVCQSSQVSKRKEVFLRSIEG